jgi:hypothetical protein
MTQHVVTDVHQVFDIQAKGQAPETGQQNTGKVSHMRRRMAQGIHVGIE